jgi:ABC-2 type transport system ATP-binding protein
MATNNGTAAQAAKNGVALRCKGLIKRYPDVVAVNGLDLEVRFGECFGLLGPNGAGKTTTIEICEGLNKPDEGVVELLGHAWGSGYDREMRNRFGVQLQETKLSEKLTVEETLRLFCSFYSNGRRVEELIQIISLEEKQNARVGKLSGGQRQRLAIACALAGDPELLFLDEPTTGLDPQARLSVWEIVEQFKAQSGSVILTTHYMEEAARLCDRLAIMDHGKIIAQGTPRELIHSLGADQIIEFTTNKDLEHDELMQLSGVRGSTKTEEKYSLTVVDISEALPALLSLIEKREASLITLTTHQATLEDVFVSLTGRMLRDG